MLASSPSRSAIRRGSTRVGANDERADALGMRRQHPHHRPAARRPPRRRRAADTSIGASRCGGQRRGVGEAPDVDRQQREHGIRSSTRSITIVANVAVSGSPPAAPADTAAAGRRHAPAAATSAAKPMTVGAEHGAEPRRPDRREQVLPAERAIQNVVATNTSASSSRSDARVPHVRPHVGEVGAAQKPREQGNRQKRHRCCANRSRVR